MKLKQIQDAGTCASLNVGTSENQILQLDANGKLPAVDGSNLTNITGSGGGTGVKNMTTFTMPSGGGTSIASNLPNGTFIHVVNNTGTNNLSVYLPPANSFSSGYYLTVAHYLNTAITGDSLNSARLYADGSDLIDSESSAFLPLSRDSYTLVSDGSSNWTTIQRGRN